MSWYGYALIAMSAAAALLLPACLVWLLSALRSSEHKRGDE